MGRKTRAVRPKARKSIFTPNSTGIALRVSGEETPLSPSTAAEEGEEDGAAVELDDARADVVDVVAVGDVLEVLDTGDGNGDDEGNGADDTVACLRARLCMCLRCTRGGLLGSGDASA